MSQVCDWCEGVFQPKVSHQVFCCAACRVAKKKLRNRLKAKRYYRAHRESVLERKKRWNDSHKRQRKRYMSVWRKEHGGEARMRYKHRTARACADCGKEIWSVSRRCADCYNRLRKPLPCACGKPKRSGHRQCGDCWALERSALKRCRLKACRSAGPHRHCPLCSWPMPVNERVCEHCIADHRRGAFMGPAVLGLDGSLFGLSSAEESDEELAA